MSKLVKEFCDELGYPYRTQGWAGATWQSIVTFWRPKPIHAGMPQPQRNHVFGEDAEAAPSVREADQEREFLSNSNGPLQ